MLLFQRLKSLALEPTYKACQSSLQNLEKADSGNPFRKTPRDQGSLYMGVGFSAFSGGTWGSVLGGRAPTPPPGVGLALLLEGMNEFHSSVMPGHEKQRRVVSVLFVCMFVCFLAVTLDFGAMLIKSNGKENTYF